MRCVPVFAVVVITCLLCLPLCIDAQNHVLSLDGDGDYVEIVDSEKLNNITSQVTMEMWICPASFPNRWMALLHKTDERTPDLSNRSYVLQLNRSGFVEFASAPEGQGQAFVESPPGLIVLNRWYHVAGTVDTEAGLIQLFINGVEIASGHYSGPIHRSSLPLRIGEAHESGSQDDYPFGGQMDEVRVWNVARTPEQIQANMHRVLTGDEAGLVAYLDFEGTEKSITDASGHGHDGELMGDAKRIPMQRPDSVIRPCVVTGRVRDTEGKSIAFAHVRLQREYKTVAEGSTEVDGSYSLVTLAPGSCDWYATRETEGALREDVVLRPGQNSWNPVLKPAVSIEGTALAPDGQTSHIGLVVSFTGLQYPGCSHQDRVTHLRPDCTGGSSPHELIDTPEPIAKCLSFGYPPSNPMPREETCHTGET